MIKDDAQLFVAVREAGALIQQISDYVRGHPDKGDHARIRFPRGFIKPAAAIRQNLRFVGDETLKRNVSYALMTHEVLRWMVFHTDLGGQAREMIIKEAVCLLGNVCESVTIFPGERGLGRKSSFRDRVTRLRQLEVIDDDCVDLLEWLWTKRNQEHLFDVPFREWSHYEEADWMRSVAAYLFLRDALNAWRGGR